MTVRLRAAAGDWRPEGDDGPTLRIEALGEEGRPLMVPAPLLRVVEGTTLVVSVRNDLTSPLRVHGLCARDGGACAPLDVPPGADREVRFASGRAGTYHYWATSMGAPIPFREMGGAFVVDPAGVPVEPDRVFVITEWSDLTPAQLREIMASDDSSARFLAANPKVDVHDQRAVVAVDRAAHLPPRRSRALARHQPQLADRTRCTCTGSTTACSGSATACATRPSPAARAAASSRRWCRRAAR